MNDYYDSQIIYAMINVTLRWRLRECYNAHCEIAIDESLSLLWGSFRWLMLIFFLMLVHLLSYYCNYICISLYALQGVIRVRKRVTLMAVTVTVMFGVCWVSDIIAHSMDYYTSLSTSKDTNSVIHTLILLNSAVNPFVYALINKTFRDKLKGMLYCSCAPSTGSFSPPAIVRHNAKFADKGYRQPSVGPSSS